MKYITVFITLLLIACNKEPLKAPMPETLWIDAATLSDTIIVNVKNLYGGVYYAKKNWQQFSDTTLVEGYRFVAIKYNDSILVKPYNDPTTNYKGPFLLKLNNVNDTLQAQNFLDTSSINPARTFIRLH